MSNDTELDEFVGHTVECGLLNEQACDCEAIETRKALLAWRDKEVAKARIDELKHILEPMEGISLNFDPEINPITRDERIAELEKGMK